MYKKETGIKIPDGCFCGSGRIGGWRWRWCCVLWAWGS